MQSHIFGRLSRCNDIFNDLNVKTILEGIFLKYDVIDIGEYIKNDRYILAHLLTKNNHFDGNLMFNQDRIYIELQNEFLSLQIEMSSTCDVKTTKFYTSSTNFVISEINEKYDYLDLSDHKKNLTELKISDYYFDINRYSDIKKIGTFKNLYNAIFKYNIDAYASEKSDYYAKLYEYNEAQIHYNDVKSNINYFKDINNSDLHNEYKNIKLNYNYERYKKR